MTVACMLSLNTIRIFKHVFVGCVRFVRRAGYTVFPIHCLVFPVVFCYLLSVY
jgi:hypothetical protein